LGIFRSRNLSGANLIQVMAIAGMFGMFFLGVLYMQRVVGYDSLEIGLAFLPVAVAMGTLSFKYSDRVIIRFGAKTTLLPGLMLITAGLALFAVVPEHAAYVTDILPAASLMGIGAGLAFPALMTLSMSGVSPSEAGLASGLANTTMQVGGALGLAVLATLATSRTDSLLASGSPEITALTSGYRLGFVVSVGLVLAAMVVAVIVLKSDRRQPEGGPEGGVELPEQRERDRAAYDIPS
jgi:MFS family permease